MRNINTALSKNRRILEELLPEGEETAKASIQKMIQKGFLFKHVTHLYTTKTGKTYYCYEYGYLPLDNDWYLIVKKRRMKDRKFRCLSHINARGVLSQTILFVIPFRKVFK